MPIGHQLATEPLVARRDPPAHRSRGGTIRLVGWLGSAALFAGLGYMMLG